MPTAAGTLQFPQSFPGCYFLRRLEKEETVEMKATPLIFLLKKWHLCVCVCVCMYSVYYFVMIPIFFFPPKFAVIFSTEGAFWLL